MTLDLDKLRKKIRSYKNPSFGELTDFITTIERYEAALRDIVIMNAATYDIASLMQIIANEALGDRK